MVDGLTSVKVRFGTDLKPKMEELLDSIVQFGIWSDEHLAQALPVDIQLPDVINQRLEHLKGYLKVDGWPREVHIDAKRGVHDIVEKMLSSIYDELVAAVRLVVASTIRDDGSRATRERDKILESYLAAKAIALGRALDAYWLVGEETWSLKKRFRNFKTVYSPNLIYGLAPTIGDIGNWSGWTDAHLHILGQRHRVYLPILSGNAAWDDLSQLDRYDRLALLVPQIIEQRKCSYQALRDIIFDYDGSFCPELIYRDEVFLDCETCTDHYTAKSYVERIAAEKLAHKIRQIEDQSERDLELMKLTIGNHGLDLIGKVTQLLEAKEGLKES